MKPNNFPTKPILNGTEELYTQTGGVSQKFTLESAKAFITEPTDITYSELYDKVTNGELIVGSWYRLTDYKSVNFLNGWDIANNNPTPVDPNFNPREIYEGEIEVLLLQAISSSEISPIGYSETFQGDIVQYEPYTNKIGVGIGGIYNGQTLPDSSVVSDFDLQWDGTNVYFNMPTNYPALFGHYFYLYAEFADTNVKGAILDISLSADISGLGFGSFSNITPTTLTGVGNGLILSSIDIGGKGLTYGGITDGGNNFSVGDTLLVLGSEIGGVDGVNDVTITVSEVDAKGLNYYQDGTFEPLTPNISICQYPSTSDDPDFNYPKAVSRIRIENNGTKVVLIDLIEADYNGYIADTLYVDHVYALGDAYGWVTKRIDTLRNITAPLDFRGRKYRRFEVDLSTLNSALGTNYFGIGDNFLNQGTTGNYKDFKVFGEFEAFNIKWDDLGGPEMINIRGYNDNNLFGTIQNSQIASYVFDNTIGQCNGTIIGILFSGNVFIDSNYNIIGSYCSFNLIGAGNDKNTIGDYFSDNRISNFFANNYISKNALFIQNQIGSGFRNNFIYNEFNNNTIGNDMVNNIFNNLFNSNIISSSQFRLNVFNININATDFTSATHVYGVYNCEILRASNTNNYLKYFDGTTIQHTTITA